MHIMCLMRLDAHHRHYHYKTRFYFSEPSFTHSFVHEDRFRNVRDLVRHLVHLTYNEYAYQKLFAWRSSVNVEGLGTMFCHLCAFLRQYGGDSDSNMEYSASLANGGSSASEKSGHNTHAQEREAVAYRIRKSAKRAAQSGMKKARKGEHKRELERQCTRPDVL